MDESAALDTTAARAVETADRDRVLWSDADREWASRAAAAIVGERASAEEFLGRRAQLVLERIGTRQPAVTRTVRGIRWRPWVGVVTVVGAFVFGVLTDRIGGGSSINLRSEGVRARRVEPRRVRLAASAAAGAPPRCGRTGDRWSSRR
jgi:hypothetical protein